MSFLLLSQRFLVAPILLRSRATVLPACFLCSECMSLLSTDQCIYSANLLPDALGGVAVELHGVSASVTVTDGPNHLFIIFSSLSLTLRHRL